MQLVNFRLLSHPVNWLFVWVILILASLAGHAIIDGVKNSTPDSSIAPD